MALPDHASTDTQAVIAGITELLPTPRQRAQEAEDARVIPADSVKSLYRGRYAATDPGIGPTEVVDTLLAWPHHDDWM